MGDHYVACSWQCTAIWQWILRAPPPSTPYNQWVSTPTPGHCPAARPLSQPSSLFLQHMRRQPLAHSKKVAGTLLKAKRKRIVHCLGWRPWMSPQKHACGVRRTGKPFLYFAKPAFVFWRDAWQPASAAQLAASIWYLILYFDWGGPLHLLRCCSELLLGSAAKRKLPWSKISRYGRAEQDPGDSVLTCSSVNVLFSITPGKLQQHFGPGELLSYFDHRSLPARQTDTALWTCAFSSMNGDLAFWLLPIYMHLSQKPWCAFLQFGRTRRCKRIFVPWTASLQGRCVRSLCIWWLPLMCHARGGLQVSLEMSWSATSMMLCCSALALVLLSKHWSLAHPPQVKIREDMELLIQAVWGPSAVAAAGWFSNASSCSVRHRDGVYSWQVWQWAWQGNVC